VKEVYKRLNNWIMRWADTRWGPWALLLCAFADSSILGLPVPMLFIVLALLNIKKVYKYALFGILGTLSGSIAGYSIGHFAWMDMNGEFTGFAQFLFNNIPGFSEAGYDKIHILYEKRDFWILFVAAALPLPYKIFSISSGVFDINIFVFCIATFISQGIKFFLLAFLIKKIGVEVKKLLEVNWKPIAIIATAGIAIVIAVIKLQNLI
jgi:membrane protein YqaA with SNARE-associated domain